jgi:hypothetical protein
MNIKQFGLALMLTTMTAASVSAELRHVEMKTLGMD